MVVGLDGGVVVDAGQVYTVVERLGAGTLGLDGGYLDLQPSFEHLFPGQKPEQ